MFLSLKKNECQEKARGKCFYQSQLVRWGRENNRKGTTFSPPSVGWRENCVPTPKEKHLPKVSALTPDSCEFLATYDRLRFFYHKI